MKNRLFTEVDMLKDRLIEIGDYIFDNPEIGLEEYKGRDILVETLKKNEFSVETNIGGMDTSFKGEYINLGGGPRIGLLCEYDAIEGIGHACGHHMQGPSIVGAAIAIKKVLKDIPYTLVVYGTPAEETIGGKLVMLKNGCFKDIDVALMMHGSPTTTTDVKSLAMTNIDVSFHGTSAHAALAPEKGRSALDGVLLLAQGVEFMREHIKEDTRIHYTITNAGGPANVVPKLATARFSLRSYDRVYLDSVISRFKKIVEGAALMTETDFSIEEIKSLNNKIPVLKLNDILMDNARLVEAPRITKPREKTGSTDFGNVMYEVPGSCIRMAFVPEGTSSHSNEYVLAGKSRDAHNAIILSAKVLAGAAYDIISDKDALSSIKKEFEENKRS